MAHIPKSHWIQSTCPWHSDTSRLEVWHAMLQRFYQWQIGVCTARCRRSKLKILVCFQKSDPEIHFRTFAHGKQLTGVSQTVGHTIPALLAAMLWKRGISMQTRYPSSRGKGSEGSPHEHGKINMIMINFQKKTYGKEKILPCTNQVPVALRFEQIGTPSSASSECPGVAGAGSSHRLT